MRKYFTFFLVFIVLLSSFLLRAEQTHTKYEKFYFIENKGQISDQYHKTRADILFGGSDGQMVFHLKATGISYQQYRIDEWKQEPDWSFPAAKGDKQKMRTVAGKNTVYRLDVNWLDCNEQAKVETALPIEGYENYYFDACPNGATNVQSYKQLTYKSIYPGIDLKWYQKEGHLKYDYVVAPGADYTKIKLEYSGADNLYTNANGDLVIVTPLGQLIEQAPIVFQNNQQLKSNWVISNNVVSFSIENYDAALPLLIDPGVRIWGTYYGGSGDETVLRTVVDPTGNVYTAGHTNTIGGTFIATVGSHQSVYGGGADNAFMVKFNSSNVRQWATYYGGPVREFGINCTLDATASNVYMSGHSLSNTTGVTSTFGSHQPNNGGIFDAFLVKFNSNGIRQWATFYGDAGSDFGMSCATDAAGNVYLAGKGDVSTGTVIATAASHQPIFGGVEDAFLVQFNSAGVRQWATHYGGTGVDNGYYCATDASGNVYMSGFTDCSVAGIIATPGAHQTTFGGGSLDAFVVKFNSSGVRQLGTYYGGNAEDRGYGCAVDQASGDVYLTGKTASGIGISSTGCHQQFHSGGTYDAFMTRLSPNFQRRWGTYYGGGADDVAYSCAVHGTGHSYIAGYSLSSAAGTLIATPGSHQPNFGGGQYDSFVAQFDTAGARTWGSYYGEIGDDLAYHVTTDNVYNVYLTGTTNSGTGTVIATPGSHQSTFNGGWSDGYIVKFYDCPAPLAPTNTTTANNMTLCAGGSSTLNVNSVGTVKWYASPTSTTSLGTGTTFVTPVLSAGVTTYYAEATTCTVSATRAAISVTVHPLPNLIIIGSPTLVCGGNSSTLNVSGAATYTWDNSSTTNTTVVTPTVSTIYSVTGTSTLGCDATHTISITVYPLDPVTLIPSTYVSCLTIFGGSLVVLTGSPSGGTYSGPNVNGNTLNPTAIGIFNPVYTWTNSTNGCVNSAMTSVQVISCMGVKEEAAELNSVSIYPNPTKGSVTIETLSEFEKTISITDLNGRLLKTETTKNKTHFVYLSEYANGVYFLKIKSSAGSKEFKILKE